MRLLADLVADKIMGHLRNLREMAVAFFGSARGKHGLHFVATVCYIVLFGIAFLFFAWSYAQTPQSKAASPVPQQPHNEEEVRLEDENELNRLEIQDLDKRLLDTNKNLQKLDSKADSHDNRISVIESELSMMRDIMMGMIMIVIGAMIRHELALRSQTKQIMAAINQELVEQGGGKYG